MKKSESEFCCFFTLRDDRQTKQKTCLKKSIFVCFARRKSKISSSLFFRKNDRRALLVLSLFLSFSLSFGWLVGWLKLFRFEESLNLRVKRVHSKKTTFSLTERENERENEEFLIKNERKRDSNNNNNNNNPEGGEEEEEEDDDDENNNINVVLADTFNGLFRDDTPRSGFDRDVLPSDVFALQLRTHRRRADERDVV